MQHIHDKKGYKPEMLQDEPLLAVTNETNRILSHGMSAGIADSTPPEAMLNKLKEDVFVFSGFKTHAELKEAAGLLLDDQNKIRPFQDFKNDVLSLNNTYNSAYLDAEYNFAIGSAQMASKWADFEKDGERYNLQYRTVGDNKVREEHEALNMTTLPLDDPFWNSFLPPNGWNCRCTTVQVRAEKYPESNSAEQIAKGEKATTRIDKKGNNADAIFRFNPGKDKVIFPPNHPYYKVSQNVKDAIIKNNTNDDSKYTEIKTDKGLVRIHDDHGKKETRENTEIATYLANKYEYKYDLLPISQEQGVNSIDAYNVTLKRYEEFKENNTATKNAIDKAIQYAKKADYIVINIKSNIDDDTLFDALNDRVKRSANIKEIRVIRNGNDKPYSREEILNFKQKEHK